MFSSPLLNILIRFNFKLYFIYIICSPNSEVFQTNSNIYKNNLILQLSRYNFDNKFELRNEWKVIINIATLFYVVLLCNQI